MKLKDQNKYRNNTALIYFIERNKQANGVEGTNTSRQSIYPIESDSLEMYTAYKANQTKWHSVDSGYSNYDILILSTDFVYVVNSLKTYKNPAFRIKIIMT